MSFAGFMGFVTGIVAGLVAAFIGMKMSFKRAGTIESDEMTRAVYQQASAFSFYATGAIVFAGWIVDNVLRNSRGEEVNVLSPWGITFFAMMYLMLVSTFVVYHRQTGTFVETGYPRQRLIATAITCIAGAIAILGGVLSSMKDMMVVLLPIAIVALSLGAVLLIAAGRRKDPAPGK